MLRSAIALATLLFSSMTTQAQQMASVVVERANLRAAPSLNAKIIVALPRGTSGTISENIDGWSLLTTATRSGWMRSNLLEIAKPVAAELDPATRSQLLAMDTSAFSSSAANPAPSPAPFQQVARLSYKDPSTATLLAFLGPGIGHLWAGETRKGATLAIIGYGGLVGGVVLSSSLASDCLGSYTYGASCESMWWPYLAGFGAYSVAWILGIVDAGNAATRTNLARGLVARSVAPVVAPNAQGQTLIGVRIALR